MNIIRKEAFAALDTERNYQDIKWGTVGKNKPIECYLVYMQSYLTEAVQALAKSEDEKVPLEIVRKITALGIACMESNGVYHR